MSSALKIAHSLAIQVLFSTDSQPFAYKAIRCKRRMAEHCIYDVHTIFMRELYGRNGFIMISCKRTTSKAI
jgi:hypothetical protein